MKGNEDSVARCDAAMSPVLDAVRAHIPEYDERAVRYGFRRAWEIREEAALAAAGTDSCVEPASGVLTDHAPAGAGPEPTREQIAQAFHRASYDYRPKDGPRPEHYEYADIALALFRAKEPS